MAMGKFSPKYGTDHQVLLKIVPNFDELMKAACEADPEFAEHLNHRVHSPEGWKPLDYFKGCL